MLITTYGYKKPQTLDTGSLVFPAMEFNIDRLDSHSHNGTDSALLTSAALPATNQDALAANWVLVSGGRYRQLITMSASLNFDKILMQVRRKTDGFLVNATIEKVTATTYYVYTNDNTVSFTIYYK